MPQWLQIGLAVLAAVLAVGAAMHRLLATQTKVLLAELGRSLAVHIAECPARSHAWADPDDSGSIPTAGKWSASGKLLRP